jgi:ActR/RegA family two-component response regulator
MKKSDINILVIEDDKTQQAALVEAIKRKGYKAVAVAKPDEAESLVKIKPIHGLIVDVMLPGRNGVDLVVRLKENLMEGAGIIFISGIYRDRAFGLEAVRKTEALDYFTKPFNMEEVLGRLEKKLKDYIDAPKVDLHALLATPFASHRERRKAFDQIENLNGYDLPFVFCILMDAESSGHLNIVDQDHNIYGVTFAKGGLAKVDSEGTVMLTKKLLVQHGFISELELGELKAKAVGGDLVRSLVDEGLMSPHVQGLVKLETLGTELKKLIENKELKINFVPDRSLKPAADDIDFLGFTPILHDMIDQLVSVEWLKSFYSVWGGHPIRLGPQFSDHKELMRLPVLKRVEGVAEHFAKEGTIEELFAACPQYKVDDLYRALHLLMVRRVLVFGEGKRAANLDEHINRLKSMHADLKGRDPSGVMKYFGLNDPKAAEVAAIYKEFAKSHHPDTLPANVDKAVKDLNHELFAKVTAAYEIFSNDQKRERYMAELKQKEAELQLRSDELVTQALGHLNRGKYSLALPMLQEAEKLYPSERSLMHLWWAQFKVEGQIKSADTVIEIERKLKAMSAGSRKSALWLFVSALVKKFNGDLKGAFNELNKTLSLDQNFMDARRELANLKASVAKPDKTDLLTGDISAVVKGFFNRKKGA